MIRRILKWFGFLMIGLVVIISVIYVSLANSVGKSATQRTFFSQRKPPPLVIAHRGGAGLFPENTLYGFEHSWNLGADVLELDVRETSDGKLVVLHDAKVDRTTDGNGLISEMSLESVKKLNAGYKFSTDGGQTFQFREQNITIPTLEEVFTTLPDAKFNIEPKTESPTIIKSLCNLIRERKMTDKVLIGSFSQTNLDNFRGECSEVATSASPSEVSKFLALYETGLSESYSPEMQALQTLEYLSSLQIVSKQFVEATHKRNLQVHVWTVNNPTDMQRLIEMGVDGIITDYPDRLLNLTGLTLNNR